MEESYVNHGKKIVSSLQKTELAMFVYVMCRRRLYSPFCRKGLSMYQLSNLRAQFRTKGMFCITLMDSSLLDYL